MCDCDFLPHYFIWNTEDTQQLYPNCLVELVCIQVCGLTSSGTFAIKDRCLATKIQIYRDAFPVSSYWVNKYLTFHILTQVVWIARIMDISDTRKFSS